MSIPSLSTAPHPLNGTYTVHGEQVTVEVSPCSWMYRNYPFQFEFSGLNTKAMLSDPKYKEKTATRAEVEQMLNERIVTEPCDTCGQPHFFVKDGSSNRKHTCEPCFMTAITAEIQALEALEEEKEARRDARQKANGFTHKTVMWVHPPRGDDYQIICYTKEPMPPADIEARLKKHRSRSLNDYTTKVL